MNLKDIFLLPNLITLLRFFSALFLFYNYTPNNFNPFTLIVIIALIGLSDSLDGIVARRLNLVSKLGIVLDPLTDRIVFIILLIALFSFGYFSKDFRLDASSETLLIEGDPDLKYLEEVTERYGSKEFLI